MMSGKRNVILIVDDMEINRAILRGVLEDEYHILEAENGEQAMLLVEQYRSAIAVMLLSGTLHPPGGATALIAVTGGEQIRQLGFWYAVVPCLAGAALMLAVAWSMTAATYLWASLYGRVHIKEGETTDLHILSGR